MSQLVRLRGKHTCQTAHCAVKGKMNIVHWAHLTHGIDLDGWLHLCDPATERPPIGWAELPALFLLFFSWNIIRGRVGLRYMCFAHCDLISNGQNRTRHCFFLHEIPCTHKYLQGSSRFKFQDKADAWFGLCKWIICLAFLKCTHTVSKFCLNAHCLCVCI